MNSKGTIKNKHIDDIYTDSKCQLIILLYHGVTNVKSRGIENYSQKHISRESFVEQMKFIKKKCNVLSIDDIIAIKNNGNIFPPYSVIVSFDDGFKNNYSIAAPILDDLHIPTVFYVTSGIVNTDIMFWVDIIEDCINNTEKKNIKLMLDAGVRFDLSSRALKIKAVETIKNYCKKVSYHQKDQVIEELIYVTTVQPSVYRSDNYLKFSWNDLKEIAGNKLFTIGGHSLYHSILSKLPSEKMKADIHLSLKLLEYHLGKKIVHYSYPEGQEEDFNDEVIGVLKKEGILCCPTAISGLNDKDVDLFYLRRIMVGFMGTPFPFFNKS